MATHYTLVPYADLSLDQLYALLRLRSEVFVVEQNCVYQDLDNLDQGAQHLLAFDEKHKLVGVARLLAPGTDYSDACAIGRIVTSNAVRGSGLGKQLVQTAIGHCRLLWPSQPIRIHAQCYLLGFYSKLGFQTCGEEYLEDGIPHKEMLLLAA